MNPFVREITSFINEHIRVEFQTELSIGEIERLLEIPPAPRMGDYAFPCFILSKRVKRPPILISDTIAQRFTHGEYLHKVVATGPYLNFFVQRDKFIKTVLNNISKERDCFGRSDEGKGKTIVIDYSSPNIAKHLAVHHLRSAVIGNAIYKLYSAMGYKCIGINHLGDWGTQFGELIVAYKRWGGNIYASSMDINFLYKLYVKYHQEAENDGSLEDEAREWFRRLEKGDNEAKRLWQLFKDISLKEFERVYMMLGIRFDFYTGESFYNEMLESTVQRIKKAGILEVSKDALIVNLDKYGMPPCLIRKKDEASLYATRDICAAEYRKKEFGFHKSLYVVGAEQRLHFQQVLKTLELMGYEWAKDCVHIDFGLVKFKDEKMSTRRGKVVLLEELLKEAIDRAKGIIEDKNPDLENKEEVANRVGIGAIIFADLKSKRIKDVNFDWDEILDFDGETGPYVQYTHARLRSVIRKYGKEINSNPDLSLLNEDDEFLLVRRLEQFPVIINMAAEHFEPSLLVNHLLEICSALNRYYNHCRIITTNNTALTEARVFLIDCVRQVIKNGLLILGLEMPERM